MSSFTCKYEEDPIKIDGARVLQWFYFGFWETTFSFTFGKIFQRFWGNNPQNTQTDAGSTGILYDHQVSLRLRWAKKGNIDFWTFKGSYSYSQFHENLSTGSEEESFKGFLSYLDMAAILVLWPA